MKSTELVLITNVLADVSTMCNTSMDRDLKTIRSRVKHEGFSFFTITLPTFAKDFERCLELGYIDPSLFVAWSPKRAKVRVFANMYNAYGDPLFTHNGQIPKFLSGIVSMVFNPEDGVLRTKPSIEAIDAVRQICLLFNRIEKECTDARKRKAIEAFIQCEADLEQVRLHTWKYRSVYCDVSRIVFGSVFSILQEILFDAGLTPGHGPGAVVEKLRGNAKYRSRSWTKRLSRAMPPDNYLFSNSEAWLEGHESLEILQAKNEPPVMVNFVPKTAKTPRVIAIEPVHMQYAQQGFSTALVDYMEADPLIGNSVRFTDQSINGKLAREASIDKSLATLDLSEASDRVHAALVSDMFGSHPILRQALFACRSSRAKLPTGQILTLKKFASMGSALCFPVESMVFFALCIVAGLRVTGKPASLPYITAVAAKITIFGDDIIVPVAWSEMVTSVLESVGLRVNRSKSFSNGSFRESCGVDAYEGHVVTPVYVRTNMPENRQDTDELVSSVATCNLFYKKGYWKTANYMRLYIENLYGFLPHVDENSSVVGWKSFQRYYSVERWNRDLSRFEIYGLTVKSRSRKDLIEGYDRLLRFFLEKNRQNRIWRITREYVGNSTKFKKRKKHFLEIMAATDPQRSTLRDSAYTKRRWTTPY